MARDFGPFPSKPMYEVVNRRMQKALAEASGSTGFVKSGQGGVTAGTGAQLVIAAYPDGALVDGLWVENPTSETVTLTTNTGSTNPRIDRLVMRLDMGAQTIAPFQIVGTPAASPQVPPLVQTATTYDMPLCRYQFPGSGSAQNPGSVVDERPSLAKSAITAYRSTNQPIGSALETPTVIGLNAAEAGGVGFDVAGDIVWVTGGSAGTYSVMGLVSISEVGPSRVFASIFVNGVERLRGTDNINRGAQNGDIVSSAVNGEITVAVNDQITLRALHTGAPATVAPGLNATRLQLRRVA